MELFDGIKRLSLHRLLVLLTILSSVLAQAAISKTNYKNNAMGKIKDSQYKISSKLSVDKEWSTASTEYPIETEMRASTQSAINSLSNEEKRTLVEEMKSTASLKNLEESSTSSIDTIQNTSANLHKPFATNSTRHRDTNSTPCTCGIFLSSQLTKGSSDQPPRGEAVISNSLEKKFPCNGVGQKQCQTKCLQELVQHIPNSANILCAALDYDIYRERANLLIKNCEDKWINTKLAAGREYCCRNREPYCCK
ncbi:follicle cell protein 3C [Haematobia irritans]|uniref:follicle cell protein 3C n=1 Tax=Haematobia irritans TaxID=7368 RepID=UPI003F50787B